ncbi:MAG: DUF3834 domain-containing protein [Candidatus Aramenus sp.]|jgi:hypothetical protein|nr:DUF3834 domain-containing protein [Candidatus Aramenus sp.]
MKVSTPTGPVAYPLIASTMKRRDFEISFDSRDGDVVLDSSASLVLDGLRVHYSLISRMLVFHPKLGRRIGVWKRGSASDVIARVVMATKGLSAEVVYVEQPDEVFNLLRDGVVDSALVTNVVDGEIVEDLLPFYVPGICGAHVRRFEEDFLSVYQEGIDLFREDPEGASVYVADNLPVLRASTFIERLMGRSALRVEKVCDYSQFERVVKEVAQSIKS